MEYFITAAARKESGSTAFFEFQVGAFKNKFWQPDSLYLSAERMAESGLSALLRETLPGYSPYGVTRVTKKQWAALLSAGETADAGTRKLLSELTPWVQNCFQKRRVFHILGL